MGIEVCGDSRSEGFVTENQVMGEGIREMAEEYQEGEKSPVKLDGEEDSLEMPERYQEGEKSPVKLDGGEDSPERPEGSSMGQEREKRKQAGCLYLCATPIGNLEDITLRVLRVLREVDLIAAEDTRNSLRLLNHFSIRTPLTSYHEYNKYDKARYLVEQMRRGLDVALVTDAGTPGISDPGEELVRQCYEAGISVTSLPGPAACITALTVSGLSTRRFCFEAFLPHDKKERQWILGELKEETRTIVIYEAPHHLMRTLGELEEALGGERQVRLCRELTKRYEEVYASTLAGALEYYGTQEPRGEYVLVLEGRSVEEIRQDRQRSWEEMSMEEHMELYLAQGLDRKEAMKLVAKDRGISKRDVYKELVGIMKEKS